MSYEQIKTLAENWFNPRLEERRTDFSRRVQLKLGEFVARGTARSGFAYAAVEDLAYEEVEQRGRLMLEGYEQSMNAVSGPVDHSVVIEVKRNMNSSLTIESVRIHKQIQFVRDAVKPARVKDAAELRIRTLQKLGAELDLFHSKLNTRRGIPTFGWKPSSATSSTFRVYEQGELSTADLLNELIRLLYNDQECNFRYYYRDGDKMDIPLSDAIKNRDVLVKSSEWRYFKTAVDGKDFVHIPQGEYKWDWQKAVAEETPEFVQLILELSSRKRTELDTINRVHVEEQYREQLKRQKYSFDVFLSYSDQDRESASRIYDKVLDAGGKLFMAPKEVVAGDDFAEEIRNALIGSRELWLLVSPNSIKSEWVTTEWGAAWALQKRIVPILYQCQRTALSDRLRRHQCIDLHLIDDHIARAFPAKEQSQDH